MKKYQGLIARYTRRGYVPLSYSAKTAVFREAGFMIHDVISETEQSTTYGFWIPRWAVDLLAGINVHIEPRRTMVIKSLRQAKNSKTFRATLQSIKTLGDQESLLSYIENVFGGKPPLRLCREEQWQGSNSGNFCSSAATLR